MRDLCSEMKFDGLCFEEWGELWVVCFEFGVVDELHLEVDLDELCFEEVDELCSEEVDEMC